MKVGDRVRCVDARDQTKYYNVGAEGVVIDVDTDVCVKFDRGEYRTSGDNTSWFGEFDQFEVIE